MQLESWKLELVEALRLLQQQLTEEIDVGRMLELSGWCFGEGELLYCLVFLKIARYASATSGPCEPNPTRTRCQ
jgi:hypothetical protein